MPVGLRSVRSWHLLTAEDGPWDLLVRMRRIAGTGAWGRLLDCFYCLSLWLALPTALLLGDDWKRCSSLRRVCQVDESALVAGGARAPAARWPAEHTGMTSPFPG